MTKLIFVIGAITLVSVVFYTFTSQSTAELRLPEPTVETVIQIEEPEEIKIVNVESTPTEREENWPISRATERITKKEFGQLVEAGHSPVHNDRFSGYHVGIDFELFEDELELDVPILAICDGPLVLKRFANGYGGVAVQSCSFDNQEVRVVYGHLNLASIVSSVGDQLTIGETVGLLGADHSPETDGVRKHLHLGVHKGATLDLRGYVQDQAEINNWIDPFILIEHGIM